MTHSDRRWIIKEKEKYSELTDSDRRWIIKQREVSRVMIMSLNVQEHVDQPSSIFKFVRNPPEFWNNSIIMNLYPSLFHILQQLHIGNITSIIVEFSINSWDTWRNSIFAIFRKMKYMLPSMVLTSVLRSNIIQNICFVYIYSNIQVSKLGIFLVYTWGNERQDFLWTTNECISDHCLNFTANHYYTDSGFNCTTLPGIT